MEIKKKISLIDTNFTGRDIINMPNVNFSWWNKNELVSDHVFITDTKLEFVDKINKPGIKKIAWLLEPKGILPDIYEWILENYKKFDKVLTFDRDIIAQIDNGLFAPYGTYWAEKTNKEKTKLVSMVASFKNEAPGHKIRHAINKHFNSRVDIYGSITGNRIDSKNIGLDNYKYSFAIENCIQDGYFSEKLLDCFATKTIPLYWGSKSVSEFFNPDGIIFLQDFNSIQSLLDFINDDVYNSKIDAIQENLEKIDSYHIPEIYIEKNYNNLLK